MLTVKAIAIGVMAAVLILLALLKLSVDICEWYSLNISASLIKAVNAVTSLFEFSIFELLIYLAAALALAFLIFIIVALCRKQFKRALNSFVDLAVTVVLVGTIYGIFAIVPYGRAPADIPKYESSELNAEQVYDMAEKFVEEISHLAAVQNRNEKGELVIDGGIKGLNESLQSTYEEVLTSDYYYDSFLPLRESAMCARRIIQSRQWRPRRTKWRTPKAYNAKAKLIWFRITLCSTVRTNLSDMSDITRC